MADARIASDALRIETFRRSFPRSALDRGAVEWNYLRCGDVPLMQRRGNDPAGKRIEDGIDRNLNEER
jgi:hypothetical protein